MQIDASNPIDMKTDVNPYTSAISSKMFSTIPSALSKDSLATVVCCLMRCILEHNIGCSSVDDERRLCGIAAKKQHNILTQTTELG